ncbi:MAG TPA: glycosyltransferase family 4 protein [Gaiellaceae bacterium]|nr:glycosyltransferase family 4 protein [Gaiellaceae bacterium]
MTLDVLLVQPGFGERGGVTVDVLNLAEGLKGANHHARTAGSFKRLVSELSSRTPSVVHVFGCLPSPTIFGAMALARLRRIPLVWTPIFNPIRPQTWRGYGLLRAMQAFDLVAPHAARWVDAVIAAMPREARLFEARGAKRVELIPPGVDPPEPPASEEALSSFRSSVGLKAGPVVLVVGRDNSRKALPFGLESFARLRRRVPDAQLLLVGPDSSFSGARQPGVVCPGWLEAASMPLAYQASDVLFVPSLYEGLPRAVIEAWRWGTPAVATDRVALAPMIADGAGRVVAYGNPTEAASALESLLSDREDRERFGRVGERHVVSRFLKARLTTRTIALYRELSE